MRSNLETLLQGSHAFLVYVERQWMLLQRRWRDPEFRVLLCLGLLALALRLAYLDTLPLNAADIGRLQRSQALLSNPSLPLVGELTPLAGATSPDNIADPPGLVYGLALPLLLGSDPRWIAAYLALLNVAAVMGCYGLARRYLGVRAAVVAAGLYAANPWGVLWARQFTAASVLAPLGLLALYGLYTGIHDRDPWGWLLAWLLACVAFFTTLWAWPLLAIVAVLSLLYMRRVSPIHAAMGLGAGLLLFFPYLYYEGANDYVDLRALVGLIWQGTPATSWSWQTLVEAARLHSGLGIERLAGASATAFGEGRPSLAVLDDLAALLFWLALPGLAALAMRAWARWRGRQQPSVYVIPLVWLLVGLLALAAQPADLDSSAFALLWPAGFVAVGALFDGAWRWLARSQRLTALVRTRLGQAIWVVLLLVVAWQSYETVYFLQFAERYDTTGGYGTPYRLWRQSADAAARAARESGVGELWIVADGADPRIDTGPAILDYLLAPKFELVFLGHGAEGLLLPLGRPAVYLLTHSSPELETLLVQLHAREGALITRPTGEAMARVVTSPGLTVDEMVALIPTRWVWPLEAGPILLGYTWSQAEASDTATLATFWTFGEPSASAAKTDYSALAYIVDEGVLQAQSAAPLPLAEADWQPGRFLVQWQTFVLPAEGIGQQAILYAGLYRLDTLWPSRLLDDQGEPINDWVELGPVPVRP